MKTLGVGNAAVSIINVGNFNFRLKDVSTVSESEWKRAGFSDIFENPKPYPSQCVFISFPHLKVLVDAGDYSRFAIEGTEYADPSYKPPPNIVESLSELGTSSQEINYVVITHAHYDHYAGVTMKIESSGMNTPTFPSARHLLGTQDFESPEMQAALRDPTSTDSQTLGILLKNGLLELVQDGRELSDEIEIIASPGETPGHKIVRIASEGKTLYCVGDLFHHAVEVSNPTWMATWDDPKTNLASREKLVERALSENALIAAAHMPLGHIEENAHGVKFVAESGEEQ